MPEPEPEPVPTRTDATAAPSDPWISRGVCPGECCTYRTWTARLAAPVHDAPNGARIGEIAVGEQVEATTGEVHLKPLRAVVRRDRTLESREPDGPGLTVHPGDTVWVLSFLGEGYAELWASGTVYTGEVIGVFDEACGRGAPASDDCWLSPDGAPGRQAWWARVTRADGSVGWVDNTDDALGGFDACG